MNYVNNTYQYGPTKVRTIVDLDDPKEFFICASDLEKVSPIYTVHSYLERDDTKALMEAIPKSGCKNQPVDGGRLIKTVAEGANRGTWFCRALAIDFCSNYRQEIMLLYYRGHQVLRRRLECKNPTK